ncbi:MAG: sporulation protein YtxC [Bacillota bacterium]
MELTFCVTQALKREFAAVLHEEIRSLRRERFRCREIAAGNGVFRVTVSTASDNEARYVRLRLIRAVGSFLALHALDIRAEDFLRKKDLWGEQVRETIKRQLQAARGLLAPAKAEIIALLNDYLSEESWIDLQGFLRFRLRKLDAFLTAIIWRLLDEAMLEQEWREFIALLKRFKQRYTRSIKQIHCLPDEDGGFTICDKRGTIIKEIPPGDIPHGESENDDLLISTFLAVGAQRVIIHGYKPCASAIKILRAVFSIKECAGCSLCRKKEGSNPVKG